MPGFVFLSRQVELLDVKIVEFFLRNVLPVLNFSATKIDLRCSVLFPFFFRRREKKVSFYNQSFFEISPIKSVPFLKFSRDHLRSTLGITCGRGSFAAHFGDHLRSWDHLRLGIIFGTVQYPKEVYWDLYCF